MICEDKDKRADKDTRVGINGLADVFYIHIGSKRGKFFSSRKTDFSCEKGL
jgi:hypothetical protein